MSASYSTRDVSGSNRSERRTERNAFDADRRAYSPQPSDHWPTRRTMIPDRGGSSRRMMSSRDGEGTSQPVPAQDRGRSSDRAAAERLYRRMIEQPDLVLLESKIQTKGDEIYQAEMEEAKLITDGEKHRNVKQLEVNRLKERIDKHRIEEQALVNERNRLIEERNNSNNRSIIDRIKISGEASRNREKRLTGIQQTLKFLQTDLLPNLDRQLNTATSELHNIENQNTEIAAFIQNNIRGLRVQLNELQDQKQKLVDENAQRARPVANTSGARNQVDLNEFF